MNTAIHAAARPPYAASSQSSNSVSAGNPTNQKSKTCSLFSLARITTWHSGNVEPKQKPIQPAETRIQAPTCRADEYYRWMRHWNTCARLVKAAKRRSGLSRLNPWLTEVERAGTNESNQRFNFLSSIPTCDPQ